MSAGGGRRRNLPPDVRLKVWVRSGGRCVICNRYLLDGKLTGREATFGELAHIVGQQTSSGSPRGLDGLDQQDRDDPENLVLVCDDEHDELDKKATRDLFSVDWLRELKRAHEERVRHVTGFSENQSTVVLRMIGRLKGNAVEVDQEAAAAAVIHSAKRFPRFDLAYDRHGIEIDLRHLAGEVAGNVDYYRTATAVIDEVIDHKLHEGVAKERINHVSVFAFARLPLLVYLGSRLDDNVPTDIYQRHRSTEAWEWPSDDRLGFTIEVPSPEPGTTEGVLIINISGSVQTNEVPGHLAGLPHFGLTIANATPSPDVVTSRRTLEAFERTFRGLLGEIEASHKQIRLLHTIAAIPLSTGVVVGRTLDPQVHPSLLVYDRTPAGYVAALEIGRR